MRIKNDLEDLWDFLRSYPGEVLAYFAVLVALAILTSTIAEYICR